MTKYCPRCRRTLPLADFNRCHSAPDGHQRQCRECGREYRAAHRERRSAVSKAWREAHRKEIRAYGKARREAHPEKGPAATRAWQIAHPKECRAYAKAYYAAHRQEKKAYYAAHRDECNANAKAWRKAHPEQRRDIHHVNTAKRRARLRGATIGDAKDLRSAYNLIRTAPRLLCYWCGKVVATKDRHVDHIIPIAKGGAHAAWNLCCACAGCNLKKHARLPCAFVGQGELILGGSNGESLQRVL